jgi:alkanesulfonate monooxygenase SsuD/methylene tetrahydromethanopterin reductase-like flavin-dependent oxidoreductase (luciferase family)
MRGIKFAASLALIFFTIIFPNIALSDIAHAAGVIRHSHDEARKISEDSARYFEAAKRSLKLQTEMPADITRPREQDWRFFNFSFSNLANASRVVLIISIVTIIAVVLYNLNDNMWSRSRTRKLEFERNEKPPDTGVAVRMEIASAEADDLASAGSFAEAIHVLLLRSVSEMRLRLNSPIAESLTSREILRDTDLSPEMRGAFATIVGSVEISYFGSHRPGKDEYAECRRSFDALTELLRRGRK